LLHQVGDLFELNVKLRCQKVNMLHGSKLLQRKKKRKIKFTEKMKTCKFHAINNNGNKFLFLVNENKTKHMQAERAVHNEEKLC
jgi:hypothetical protein